jgi:hypothetical protein
LSSRPLDLSQLKVLRALEIADWITTFGGQDTRHAMVVEMFSTIASPVFFELIVVLWYDQFAYLPSDARFFEILRVMSKIRPFNLVFLLQVSCPPSGERRRRFERATELLIEKELFAFLDSPVTVRVVQLCI